jgi:hypothetical protein
VSLADADAFMRAGRSSPSKRGASLSFRDGRIHERDARLTFNDGSPRSNDAPGRARRPPHRDVASPLRFTSDIPHLVRPPYPHIPWPLNDRGTPASVVAASPPLNARFVYSLMST